MATLASLMMDEVRDSHVVLKGARAVADQMRAEGMDAEATLFEGTIYANELGVARGIALCMGNLIEAEDTPQTNADPGVLKAGA